MAEDLKTRLEELRLEIEAAPKGHRMLLLERLEQLVMSLETRGSRAPGWAKALIDQSVEDRFDNMPV